VNKPISLKERLLLRLKKIRKAVKKNTLNPLQIEREMRSLEIFTNHFILKQLFQLLAFNLFKYHIPTIQKIFIQIFTIIIFPLKIFIFLRHQTLKLFSL